MESEEQHSSAESLAQLILIIDDDSQELRTLPKIVAQIPVGLVLVKSGMLEPALRQ